MLEETPPRSTCAGLPRWAGALAIVLAMLGAGCGGRDEAPSGGATTATTETSGALVFPYSLDQGADLPPAGSDARALLERWAAIEGTTLESRAEVQFEAHLADELGLLGPGALLEVSGAPLLPGHVPHGIVHFLVEDGQPGRVLRIVMRETRPRPDEIGAATDGPRAWLLAAEACPDEPVIAARPPPPVAHEPLVPASEPGPLAGCEARSAALAAALLSRLGAAAGREEEALTAFLTALQHVADPSRTLRVVDEASEIDAAGAHTLLGRAFVPFSFIPEEGGAAVATGTLRVEASCGRIVDFVHYTLRLGPERLSLAEELVATAETDARCTDRD